MFLVACLTCSIVYCYLVQFQHAGVEIQQSLYQFVGSAWTVLCPVEIPGDVNTVYVERRPLHTLGA